MWRPVAELILIHHVHHVHVVVSGLADLYEHGSLLLLVIRLQLMLLILELLASWIASVATAEHHRVMLLTSTSFCVQDLVGG